MTKLALVLIACGTALVPVLPPAPAHAQSVRTWVASNGSDANPCSRAQPCLTFAGALANTHVNGEINCIDNGSFGGMLTITKSVTIDCHDVLAVLTACFSAGIQIDIPVSGIDPLRTVRLRNLNISGSTEGTTRCGVKGIRIANAAVVSIEGVVVQGFTQRGISDERTTGGRLTVTNSTLRNNGTFGLVVLPASGSTRIDVAIDNVVVEGNGNGMAFANGARAMVSRSLIANNAGNGIEADNISGGSGASVGVHHSTISNNSTGLFTFGGGALFVSNTDIAFNAQAASGVWLSFSNNRIHSGFAIGTAPTAIGVTTHDTGQM